MSIFLKTENQYPQSMKQASKEALQNNMHHHGNMKTISNAYISNQKSPVQEAVYHILPELSP